MDTKMSWKIISFRTASQGTVVLINNLAFSVTATKIVTRPTQNIPIRVMINISCSVCPIQNLYKFLNP